MSQREQVEFKALDGVTLRGHFYPASSPGKSSAVIMTPGVRTPSCLPIVRLSLTR